MKRKIKKRSDKVYQFDVALSFAGENRDYVEKVAYYLQKIGFKLFYDKYETVTFWGKDLYQHLEEVYFKNARYTIMFISKSYAKKLWTNHERRSAQARAFSSNQEYILPARFDNTKIPGVLPTVGYIDLNNYSPKEFALIIKDKIGQNWRSEFLPDDIDVLYKTLKARAKAKKDEIYNFTHGFHEALKLMKEEERVLIFNIFSNSCPMGLQNDAHLNLELLSRISGYSVESIISILSRLDCLGIKTELGIKKNHDNDLCSSTKVVTVKYIPYFINTKGENGTYVVHGIIDTMSNNICPACRIKSFQLIDFSILSSYAGFPEL
jgi:hypothetical protein